MNDPTHERFNSCRLRLMALHDDLQARGYYKLASDLEAHIVAIDALHHDYASLIEDLT